MGREPKRLKDVLDRGEFAVTVEYNPPKGTNINGVLDNAKQLLGRVHGVNVTDNTAAVVRAGSLPPLRRRPHRSTLEMRRVVPRVLRNCSRIQPDARRGGNRLWPNLLPSSSRMQSAPHSEPSCCQVH